VGAALFVLVCLLFEGAFSFVARSHAVGYTLAARLWFGRCWGARANSLGYRDHEHVDDGRPNLFVLGDSFVAGVGTCDPDERFTDRLQGLLGDDYQVHNLGWNGSDTRNEYERLLEYPFTPRVLVLAYYINDITGAAGELGHSAPPFTPYLELPGPLRHLVMRSYVLDFAYWLVPHDDLAWQAKFNARCYTWPDVVARHQEELQRIVDWARERQCPLIALLFPSLTQVETSGPWLAPALELFTKDEVPVVDVRPLVKGHSPAELVANANDAHPSAWLHARVAEALAAKLVELGLAEAASR
jgi:lysophospholipase L1-like esterase